MRSILKLRSRCREEQRPFWEMPWSHRISKIPAAVNGAGLTLYGRQYNFQTPYQQTFNLTVQDQFTQHDSILFRLRSHPGKASGQCEYSECAVRHHAAGDEHV